MVRAGEQCRGTQDSDAAAAELAPIVSSRRNSTWARLGKLGHSLRTYWVAVTRKETDAIERNIHFGMLGESFVDQQ